MSKAKLTLCGAILFATGFGAGCCTVRTETVVDLRRAWGVYKAATVPHPDYTPEEVREVEELKKDLDDAFSKLEEATK
jgi:hypothetical protein